MKAADCAIRWNRWNVIGTKEEIEQFINELNGNLPTGWRPSTQHEIPSSGSAQANGGFWYTWETDSSNWGIILKIQHLSERYLTGGDVRFTSPTKVFSVPDDCSVSWNDVMDFLDKAIAPAAKASGIQAEIPSFQDMFLSDLPFDARQKLLEFTKLARKVLPLNRQEAEVWQKFVIWVFRTKAIVDTDPFIAYLIAEGWPKETAEVLCTKLYDQYELLARYAEEVSVV